LGAQRKLTAAGLISSLNPGGPHYMAGPGA